MALLLAWAAFAACAALIWFAGVRLARYGDLIAEKTGAGRAWTGLVLLATVTSLPELVTGLSSVSVAGAPDIAAGDVFGSCLFNLAILAVVDTLYRRQSVFGRIGQGQLISAAFGVVLIGFAGITVLVSRLGLPFGRAQAVLAPLLIAGLYALAMRTIFVHQRAQRAAYVEERAAVAPDMPLRLAALRYAAWAMVILFAGGALPVVGKQLAAVMGWDHTFVGSLFVAFATSVPELVVTWSAVSLGAVDLAIGNLFGSNLFNIFILALDDLAYARGPLLADVSVVHVVTALSALVMTGVAMIGILQHPRKRMLGMVTWASLLLFLLYLVNAYVLFLHGA